MEMTMEFNAKEAISTGLDLMCENRFGDALHAWEELRKESPKMSEGWSHAIIANIAIGNAGEAESLIQPWLINARETEPDCFAEAYRLVSEGCIEKAMAIYGQLAQKYAQKPEYFSDHILNMIKFGFCRESIQLCDILLKSNKANFKLTELAIIAQICSLEIPPQQRAACVIARALSAKFTVGRYSSIFTHFLNAISTLAKYRTEFHGVHEEYLLRPLQTVKNALPANTRFQRDLCFFVKPVTHLPFFANIIKYFLPTEIEIILDKPSKNDKKIVNASGLSKYDISYGINKLDNFKYIVVELNRINSVRDGQKLIALHHSNNIMARNKHMQLYSLIIYQHKACADYNTLAVNGYENSRIESKYKCEVAYTGMYQYDKTDIIDKKSARASLKKEYNITIPESRKFIFVVQDNRMMLKHICHTLNKLSKNYTIALKPIFWEDANIQSKLDPNIIVVPSDSIGVGAFRFAADVILASITSGTLITSIMLGQPVLPYFTRLLKLKLPHTTIENYNPGLYKNYNILYMDHFCDPNAKVVKKFQDDNMVFDILNTDQIREAIADPHYIKWYYGNLDYFQQNFFKDYARYGAAAKTADYIRKFVKDGTLGSDCESIYLKNNYHLLNKDLR